MGRNLKQTGRDNRESRSAGPFRESEANLTSSESLASRGLNTDLVGRVGDAKEDDLAEDLVLDLVRGVLVAAIVVDPRLEDREVLAVLVGL